jgi:hypothetical protein
VVTAQAATGGDAGQGTRRSRAARTIVPTVFWRGSVEGDLVVFGMEPLMDRLKDPPRFRVQFAGHFDAREDGRLRIAVSTCNSPVVTVLG